MDQALGSQSLTTNGGTTPADSPARIRKGQRRLWGKRLRRLAWIALALGIVVLIVLAWLPKPVPVNVQVARRGPMQVTVDNAGRTRVKDRHVVSAPLSANVARIELRPNDLVKPGDVVARFAPTTPPLLDERSRAESQSRFAAATAAGKQARAALERAKLASEHTRRELEQDEKLAVSGAISPHALELARFEQRLRAEELTSAEFAAQVADHETDLARAAIRRFGRETNDEFLVTSPISGRVLKILQESAGLVQAGAPLVEIGDPSALEIVSDVLTSDAVHVAHGAHVLVERWGDEPLAGHVRLVEPSAFTRLSALGVEEQRVKVIIDIDDPPAKWSRLGDGYRVETRIVVWQAKDVLALPSSAVFRQGEGWAAFVIDENVAHLRPIEVGRRNDVDAQILAGLTEGELIILHPSERVADGKRIAPRR